MKTKLKNALNGQSKNHILPFFWQHGEDDQTLLNELHRIYDCGIRAVCVEARPYPQVGQEPWFGQLLFLIGDIGVLVALIGVFVYHAGLHHLAHAELLYNTRIAGQEKQSA